MKKVLVIILCGIVLLSGVAWGTFKLLETDQEVVKTTVDTPKANVEDDAEREELEVQREEIDGKITEDDLATYKEQGLNPFGEQTKMNELSDYRYQEYIHGMSHQKVKAQKKWGYYEIHPQRIHWLLEGLDQVNLDHENVYRDILEKWNKDDFASVDDDHNAIWNLQGGTVGRATGILSAQEEQNYVDRNTD